MWQYKHGPSTIKSVTCVIWAPNDRCSWWHNTFIKHYLHFAHCSQHTTHFCFSSGAAPFESSPGITTDSPIQEGAKALGWFSDPLQSPSRHIPLQVLAYQIVALCSHAGIEDLAEITVYLHLLGRTAIFNLGLVLGLNYSRLKSLIESSNFLNKMLAGWLQRVDQVQKVGVPTWRRLEEALRDLRVGQNGIASKIEQDK